MSTIFNDPAKYMKSNLMQVNPDTSIRNTQITTWGTTQTTNNQVWTEVNANHRVRYANTQQNQSDKALTDLHLQVQANTGLTPIFYLPWRKSEIIGITLAQPNNNTTVNHFVTGPLDGCAIYIEGTPQQPIIYHANAFNLNTGLNPDSVLDEPTQVFHHTNRKLNHMNQYFGAVRTSNTGQAMSLSMFHYSRGTVFKNDALTLQQQGRKKFGVKANTPDVYRQNQPNVIACRPSRITFACWGTLFGIRDTKSGVWTFYCQSKYRGDYLVRKTSCKGDRVSHWDGKQGWMPPTVFKLALNGMQNGTL